MKIYTKTQIDEIAECVKSGGVIAIPTETVYGFAASVNSISAIKKIDQLKNRDKNKAYPLMIADQSQISDYVLVDEIAKEIIEQHLPGELTIVLPKNPGFKNKYFDSLSTIGVRVPDDKFLHEVLTIAGPMIVTSANKSGEPPLVNSKEVENSFSNVDVIVEGVAGGDLPTTVIEIKDCEINIYRQGKFKI